MSFQPIMLTLIAHFEPEQGWAVPYAEPRPWIVARAFDALAPLPQSGAPEGVVTLVTLAGDETGYLWGVRESVEDIANLVDARRVYVVDEDPRASVRND
jgi:hypothetical protein